MRSRIIFFASIISIGWFFAPQARNLISFCVYPYALVDRYAVKPVISYLTLLSIKRDYDKIIERYHQENRMLLDRFIQAQARCTELEQQIPFVNDQYPHPTIPARVIYRDLSPSQQILIVDKGSLHGIELDMVAAEHHCLVGRVVEVYPWYSKILLITHPNGRVPAVCVQSKAHGVHQGTGSSSATQLHFVSHLETLYEGELVMSSGDGLVYPAGYALGTIQKFCIHELGYLYEVTVQPCIDVQTITQCYIFSKGTHAAA